MLVRTLKSKRTDTIIVSDDGSEDDVNSRIMQVSALPETNGVRFVLSSESNYESCKRVAAANNFRDLIPLDTDAEKWVRRFYFATAGTEDQFEPPDGQLFLNKPARILVPARLTWASETMLRIETSLEIALGDAAELSGKFVSAIGLDSLGLTVQDSRHSRLRYRFSDALVCEFATNSEITRKLQLVLGRIREKNTSPKYHVFAAVKTPRVRQLLVENLPENNYEISFALHIKSMVHEPQYFSPEFVVIEDLICHLKDFAPVHEMIQSLGERVTVILLGEKFPVGELQNSYPNKTFLQVRSPLELRPAMESLISVGEMRLAQDPNNTRVFLDHEDPLSIAAIEIRARVMSFHPAFVEIETSQKVRPFSLCQLSLPSLKASLNRLPWLKLTSVGDLGGNYSSQGILTDLMAPERTRLAQYIFSLFSGHLTSLKTLDEPPIYPKKEIALPAIYRRPEAEDRIDVVAIPKPDFVETYVHDATAVRKPSPLAHRVAVARTATSPGAFPRRHKPPFIADVDPRIVRNLFLVVLLALGVIISTVVYLNPDKPRAPLGKSLYKPTGVRDVIDRIFN